MIISLAQILSGIDPKENLTLVEDGIAKASAAGARLVVFPEATMRRFGVPLREIAEPLNGPWASEVRALARDAGITVVAGMFTPSEDGRVRNTLLVAGPEVDAHYDKIHLFDAFGFAESDTVAPGADQVTVPVDGVTVGLATCYDLRFPGLFQGLADRGAVLTVLPASWGSGIGKVDQWTLLARARALDSTSFIAACGQADPASIGVEVRGTAPTGVGHSVVVAPNGIVLGQLGAEPGLLTVDIDLDQVEQVRRAIPVLRNRRL